MDKIEPKCVWLVSTAEGKPFAMTVHEPDVFSFEHGEKVMRYIREDLATKPDTE